MGGSTGGRLSSYGKTVKGVGAARSERNVCGAMRGLGPLYRLGVADACERGAGRVLSQLPASRRATPGRAAGGIFD